MDKSTSWDHRLFSEVGLEELMQVVIDIFSIKGYKGNTQGDVIFFTPGEKGKYKNFVARFTDTNDGIAVKITVEPGKGRFKIFNKKKFDPVEDNAELKSIWKYIGLKLPSSDDKKTKLEKFIAEIFRHSKKRGGQTTSIEIPEWITVKIQPGGLLSINDETDRTTRDILCPSGVISVTIDKNILKLQI